MNFWKTFLAALLGCLVAMILNLILFFMLIGALIYWQSGNLSGGNLALQKVLIYVALILTGFCIYGPVALVGVQALNMVPKNAAGTAAGFVGLFGYLFGDAIIAKIMMGSIIQNAGWNVALAIFPLACVLAMVLCALPWKSEVAMTD